MYCAPRIPPQVKIAVICFLIGLIPFLLALVGVIAGAW
jgi:hypothetical protein